jgi:hypothetical protein
MIVLMDLSRAPEVMVEDGIEVYIPDPGNQTGCSASIAVHGRNEKRDVDISYDTTKANSSSEFTRLGSKLQVELSTGGDTSGEPCDGVPNLECESCVANIDSESHDPVLRRSYSFERQLSNDAESKLTRAGDSLTALGSLRTPDHEGLQFLEPTVESPHSESQISHPAVHAPGFQGQQMNAWGLPADGLLRRDHLTLDQEPVNFSEIAELEDTSIQAAERDLTRGSSTVRPIDDSERPTID